jgi:hypothetical protein
LLIGLTNVAHVNLRTGHNQTDLKRRMFVVLLSLSCDSFLRFLLIEL